MLDMLKFSITADAKVAAAFGKVKAELTGVKGALAGIQDHAARSAKALRNVGLGMSAAATAPLMLQGRQMLHLYDEQAKAEAAVRQAIVSTSGAAGKTADELFRMASGLQEVSRYGDEDILKNVTAPLLTFTQVSDEAFSRAQQAVLDMSTLLGTDLRSTAVQVGKALNDPIKGLDGLGRAGVQFHDDQKAVIKSLVETGDIAAAQGLILDELAKQFGGQAEASVKNGIGQLNLLSKAWGDVQEQFGEQIVTFLPDLVDNLKDAVKWFADLSPEVKQNIVVFGGLTAAVGPVLAMLGLGVQGVLALSGAFTALGAALMANPILLAIAAIAAGAYLVYDNWAGITAWFSAKWAAIKEGALAGWEAIKSTLSEYAPARWLHTHWENLAGFFGGIWQIIRGDIAVSWAEIKLLLLDYGPQVLVYEVWKDVASWFAALWPEVVQAFRDLWESIKAEISTWPAKFVEIGKSWIDGLIDGFRSGFGALQSEVGSAGRNIPRHLRNVTETRSPSQVFARIGQDWMDGLGLGIRDGTNQVMDEMEGVATGITGVASAMPQLGQQAAAGFSAIVRGAESANEVVSRLLDQLSDQFLQSFFTEAFGGPIDNFVGWLFGGANAQGNAFSGGRVTAFASGGIVSGPTTFPMAGRKTGLMGEAGPEGILPLARMSDGALGVRAMSGDSGASQRVQVEVFVNDDGTLGAIAREAGASAGAAAGAAVAPNAVANDIARNGVTSRAMRGSFALARNKRGR